MTLLETIRARLDRVTDPELDASIVELGYIDRLEIDDGAVSLEFTLPTAWCSPAFAWMMAADAREELESISGVDTASIHLRDHMHATEINDGVNAGRSFDDSFPDADGEVASVRATLDDKARLSRQYDAVGTLLEAGLKPPQICALTLDAVTVDTDDARAAVSVDDAFGIPVPARPLDRYIRKARAVGVIDADSDDDRLFRTPEGDPITPESFELVQRRGRLAQTNMTGQGGICEALNESRRHKLGREEPFRADAH